MNEIRSLLLLELRSLYGINKFRHTHNPKEKNRYRGLCIVWLFLILMVAAYVGALVYGLCSLGLAEIVPAYLAVMASLLIVAFGIFTAGGRIFGQKGYEILAAMPLRANAIVISRFLCLYVEDLLFSLIIMLPGVIVYGICRNPNWSFYIMAFLGSVFIPAIPLVISVLFGTVVLAISARMKRKSMVQSVLMVFFVLAVLIGSFSMEGVAKDFTPEEFAKLAQNIGSLFSQVYPPAVWFGGALTENHILGLVKFVLVSAAVMAITLLTVSANFQKIVRRLQNYTAKHDYKIGAMERRGRAKALYVREAKRYFSSSIYVTNTIIGPIMGTVLAVALCFADMDAIQRAIAMDVMNVLPFVFSAVFCMMTTTSTAISMEGKQIWVVKTLPIPTKTLLDSKILLNLSLMLPFYIISVAAMTVAAKPSFPAFIWLVLIPVFIILFCVVFGITVNLKFHSFDWENEGTVVKQSLPAALGGFAGFFLSALLGAGVLAAGEPYSDAVKAGICVLLFMATACLYRSNNQKRLEDL